MSRTGARQPCTGDRSRRPPQLRGRPDADGGRSAAESAHAARIGRAATERDRTTCTAHRVRPRSARDERGITTAEYAVGTAAGAGFAGLLYKLLSGGFGDQLLKTLFDHVLGLLGIK